ncbi:MAG TPA: CopG family transcriptional regulator [Caldimonas sp.]|jgi:predicted transcriptional regulator
MRTTLSIDDDVLAAARHLADRQQRTVGEVVTDLVRQSLRQPARKRAIRNGVPLLPTGRAGKSVSADLVNELRDEGP